MLAINELGRPEVGTTVTPTVASAGTADNVVPAQGRIKVDVRVESADEKDRVEAAMAALSPVDPDSTIEVTGAINRPPMPESASAALMPLAEAVAPGIDGLRRRWRQRRQLHRRDRGADARRARCRRRGSARRPRVRARRHHARTSSPGRCPRRTHLRRRWRHAGLTGAAHPDRSASAHIHTPCVVADADGRAIGPWLTASAHRSDSCVVADADVDGRGCGRVVPQRSRAGVTSPGPREPTLRYTSSLLRVSVMSRLRIVNWPMRSSGPNAASSTRSIDRRSGS